MIAAREGLQAKVLALEQESEKWRNLAMATQQVNLNTGPSGTSGAGDQGGGVSQ